MVDPTEFSDAGQSVTLPDGSTLDALGRVSVPVHCQGSKDTLECVVLNLDASCDLILGDQWLHRHQAILNFAQASLSFRFKDWLVQRRPRKVRPLLPQFLQSCCPSRPCVGLLDTSARCSWFTFSVGHQGRLLLRGRCRWMHRRLSIRLCQVRIRTRGRSRLPLFRCPLLLP